MSTMLNLAEEQLTQGGYSVAAFEQGDGPTLLFESDTVLGFVLFFPDAAALLEGWSGASQHVLKSVQFALRRAERKAWNAYLVLLAEAKGDYGQQVMLGAIEENLVGTRKIARAGVAGLREMRAALLPLLEIQSAPRLDAVDMAGEIRLRTSELPRDLVEAFVSGASETTVAQILEAGQ
ncbi:hypothetical protein K3177_14785 [Qipengyuania sp. GH25]|uniref:Uncharacterized protein n=1 Tax=Qipengyuania pacifica TaxID=2860199 RepID=A0ABS7JK53_9SPHN|nr:hypothetical protein [Qipengyuania aerophila]MBX7489772.1 hypothetical protein [Qipengyuania aerophila]